MTKIKSLLIGASGLVGGEILKCLYEKNQDITLFTRKPSLNLFNKHKEINVDFENLKKLDEKNRELIQKKEGFEKEKKDISKLKDKSLFNKSKEISNELDQISEEQKIVKNQLDKNGGCSSVG